tara:strand:+ start:776 stop:2863 length:2088 start_codon:yes stop_codon:yes gene_type:complete
MKSGRSNKFSRALEHLKSTTIDEKLQLQLLSEIPTNNTQGVYTDEPERTVTTTFNPNLNPLDLTQDDTVNGTDTTGLFMPDGTILTEEPPGDTSYILGPMAAMYYTWSYPWTQIGYIRQSDRRMVNLGRIDGKLSDWDGSVGNAGSGTGTFSSYGQLTAEQARWFRDVQKQPGATNDPSTYNYYAFYPGPPSQIPDQFGRYPCAITGISKNRTVTNTQKPTHKSIDDISKDRPYEPLENQSTPHDPLGDLLLLGLSAVVIFALKSAIATGSVAALSRAKRFVQGARNWWNKGRNTRIPNENQARWRDLMRDDWAQRGRPGDGSGGGWDPTRGFRPGVPADKGGMGSGPTPAIRQAVERPIRTIMNLFQGYEYEGDFIAEEVGDDIIDALEDALKETETLGDFMKVLDGVIAKIEQRESELKKQTSKLKKQTSEEVSPRKKLIREIKKPYKVKEMKQEKLKGYRPKTFGKLHAQYDKLIQKAENPAPFKQMDETVWTKNDKYYNERLSQERKNEVLDHLGTGDHYWDLICETGKKSREKGLKEKYGDYTLVRKEQLAGDTLLFLVDEDGKKESILQSEYSDRIARQIEEPLWEQETLNAPNDPLIKRIKNKLATQIDYPDKPSPMGYPDGATPQQVAGWHPEYGKRAAYYNALDPQSADAMPLTGDPETDVKVNSQKTPLLKRVSAIRKKKGKPNS